MEPKNRTPRDFGKVCEAILPTLREHAPDVARAIEQLQQDARFIAPELMRPFWVQLGLTLTAGLPDPLTGPAWARAVSDVVEARKEAV